jgi:hypothetical protein
MFRRTLTLLFRLFMVAVVATSFALVCGEAWDWRGYAVGALVSLPVGVVAVGWHEPFLHAVFPPPPGEPWPDDE